MNNALNFRFAAAVASLAITFTLFSSVAGLAEQPAATSLLAQAATTATVR